MWATAFTVISLGRKQRGSLGLFVPFIQNLPQLCMHAVIFSLIQFLCISLLKDTQGELFPALQGPRSQSVSVVVSLSMSILLPI